MNPSLKQIGTHFLVILGFALVAVLYFNPCPKGRKNLPKRYCPIHRNGQTAHRLSKRSRRRILLDQQCLWGHANVSTRC